jgi:archaeal flagellin FlaB
LLSRADRENGFTGLEAAIVLVAFVVVAAVFSFVVLGTGFFTTQKSQEVVHTGLQQTSSSVQLVLNVYGLTQGNGEHFITYVNFDLAVGPGGAPIDFSKVVITYSNATKLIALTPTNPLLDPLPGPDAWSISAVDNEKGAPNNLLEQGEHFEISTAINDGIYPGDAFNIEIKPASGAPMTIHRTAPPSIQGVNILY